MQKDAYFTIVLGSITSRCSGKWALSLGGGKEERPDPGDGGNWAYYCLYYTSDWFKHQILRNLYKSCMYILKFFVF